MCNALCRFDFDVTLLAGEPYNKDVNVFEYYGLENNFSIVTRKTGYHRGSTFFLSIRYYPILKRLAKSNDDILFYGRDVISLYILAQAGRQVIYEVHDIFRRGPRKWAEEQLIKSQNLHKIVFISNELKKVYLKKYDRLLTDNQMIIASDAADRQPNFTEAVQLNGNFDFNACYIGNFQRGKGVELILEIARKMPDTGFHLFGGNDKQIYRLERNSASNVHFYGYLPPAQTYKIRITRGIRELTIFSSKTVLPQNRLLTQASKLAQMLKMYDWGFFMKAIMQ